MPSFIHILLALIISDLALTAPSALTANTIYGSGNPGPPSTMPEINRRFISNPTAAAGVKANRVDPDFWKKDATPSAASIEDASPSSSASSASSSPKSEETAQIVGGETFHPSFGKKSIAMLEAGMVKLKDAGLWKKSKRILSSILCTNTLRPKDAEVWKRNEGESESVDFQPNDAQFA